MSTDRRLLRGYLAECFRDGVNSITRRREAAFESAKRESVRGQMVRGSRGKRRREKRDGVTDGHLRRGARMMSPNAPMCTSRYSRTRSGGSNDCLVPRRSLGQRAPHFLCFRVQHVARWTRRAAGLLVLCSDETHALLRAGLGACHGPL